MNLPELIIFILPAYIANSAPVILHGKTPLDMGQKFLDKQPLLGKSKTIKGFVAGVFAGTVTGALIAAALPYLWHTSFNDKVLTAFLLSLGAMTGDSIGSFIKRRRGILSGQESKITDKVWFLIGALIFAFPLYNGKINLEILDIALLFALTFFLHISFNRIAHVLKLKKVPW